MIATTEKPKELAVYRRQTSGAITAANGLKIKVIADLPQASDLLKKIKTVAAVITQKKEEFTAPAREIITAAKNIWDPIINECKMAEMIVKGKLTDFELAEREQAEEEARKIAADKRMKFETKAEKINAIKKPPTQVRGNVGEIRYRDKRTPVIVDESKLPREYLMPNAVKINKDALAGIEIPGVEVKVEKIAAAY